MTFPPIPTLVITGPVGVGKSSTAFALSDQLNAAGQPHGVIDVDYLRTCYPSPENDPFNMALGLRNIAAVCANYRAAGATKLLLVDVVETPEQRADYEQAIPGAQVQIIRLTASLDTLRQRLQGRETGDDLRWHVARAAELSALMAAQGIGDIVIATDGQSAQQVAQAIRQRVGW